MSAKISFLQYQIDTDTIRYCELRSYDTPLSRRHTGTLVLRDCLSLAEKHRINMRPHRSMIQGFGHDVGWILLRFEVMETYNTGSNGFTDTMVGQSVPALGQL